MATHYDVLGVGSTASAADIKRAYYDQARLYHPDAHGSSAPAVRDEAERLMQALNQAWHVVGDAARRRRYDRTLLRGDRPDKNRKRSGATRTPQLALSSAFQPWLGGTGTSARTRDGRPAYNLRVDRRADFAPLAELAPDRLVALHAEGAPVADDDLRYLHGMTGLRVLDLTGTQVTDRGLVHLLTCTGLETLWLWNTAITDGALDLLGRLPGLRQLGLGNTAVSDTGLGGLARLRGLRLLQLWGTNVEGPGLEHLHGLPELEVVTLPWRVRGRHRRRLRAALPGAVIVA